MDHLVLKAQIGLTDAGEVTGLAWPFGTPDSRGDTISPGAFRIAVDDVPMLWNHDPNTVIGVWDEITETEAGLVVKGHFLKDSDRAKAVRSLVKSKLIDGLSVGFNIVESSGFPGRRTISKLDLHEISITRAGVHGGARILHAKSIEPAEARLYAIAEAFNRATAALHIKG